MAARKAPGISYVSMGQWPAYCGFTTCPKAFAKELKRLNVEDAVEFTKNGAAACVRSFEKDKGAPVYLITMRDEKGRSWEQKAALIAHECMHVVQRLWDDIGEDEPGREAEAYLLQHLVQSCLYHLRNKRKRA